MNVLKGWIQKEKQENKQFTEEEITEILKKTWYNERKQNTREVVIYQGCKTHGAVERSGLNLNICGDPECPSCTMMNQAVADLAKDFDYIPDIDKYFIKDE